MDFSVIFQLRSKKFWWMDVIFYFVISLLIATVFCYFIFLIKNNIQREDIRKAAVALETVGTSQQKEYEKEVLNYQKKIIDFTNLLENHEFASNVFVFLQAQTMHNVWFRQFSLDKKNNSVQLSGEADNIEAFSGQVASFEKNKYVKNITVLNSSLGASARIGFNINLILDQNIFSYIASIDPILEASASLVASTEENQAVSENNDGRIVEVQGETEQQGVVLKSSGKLITSFHLLLSPEVIGIIDEANFAVTLDVPYNTDVKKLTSSIIVSSGAIVSPASGISQNFENPVTYTVIAEDGSTQDYKVSVIVATKPTSAENPNKSLSAYAFFFIIAAVAVVVAIIVFTFLRKRPKNYAN